MEYTVVGARETARKETQYGEMADIALSLEGVESEVSWFTKATTPLPAAGEKIEGTIEESQYGPKFKKARAGGGGGRPYKPRPDDAPEVYAAKQAQIVAQHSQDMALRVLELAQASGDGPQTIMESLGVAMIREDQTPLGLVEAFSLDASRAAAAAWAREAERKAIRGAQGAA